MILQFNQVGIEGLWSSNWWWLTNLPGSSCSYIIEILLLCFGIDLCFDIALGKELSLLRFCVVINLVN